MLPFIAVALVCLTVLALGFMVRADRVEERELRRKQLLSSKAEKDIDEHIIAVEQSLITRVGEAERRVQERVSNVNADLLARLNSATLTHNARFDEIDKKAESWTAAARRISALSQARKT